MSTLTSFINPPIDSPSTSTRNLDKSISVIEALIQGKSRGLEEEDEMSYKPSDLALMKQYSESHVEPVKQNYEDLVSCSVCYDLFENKTNAKLPKILPCQHTYCVQCINNLLHCSVEPGTIDCPQCKFKIRDLKDAIDLPTSRIVLTLLEKEALNYQGYASCPSCLQIRNLEVCFHCNLPLCNHCASKHYDTWKNEVNANSAACEEVLTVYKKRIDSIDPFITKNFENVQSIKNEIDEAFNQLFQRLNTEKDLLLRTINEIKDENAKYIQFKKDIVTLMTSFKAFRETNENYEKKEMPSRLKKNQFNLTDLKRIQNEYSKLSNSPFKIVERFERKQLPEQDFNYAGSLLVSDFNLENSQPVRPRLSSSSSSSKLSPNRESFARLAPTAPPLQSSNMRNSISVANLSQEATKPKQSEKLDAPAPTLSNWMNASLIKPQSELTIKSSPNLMTSLENLLFCMDTTSNLLLFERNKLEMKLQNSYKLTVPNPKGIAANQNYFAISYSGTLKKDQLKGVWKTASPNGVMLFSRQSFVVCTVHDKIVELKNGESFKQPSAIALTDQYLFVCDRELRCVFKFDLNSDSKGVSLVQKITINGEPCALCVNKNILVIADSNSTFYVYETDTCNLIRSKNLNAIDRISSNFSLALSDDNLIFVKNAFNQLCLLDSNLEQKAFFNEIQASIHNIALLLQQPNQMLIIGCSSGQQFKLLGYNI